MAGTYSSDVLLQQPPFGFISQLGRGLSSYLTLRLIQCNINYNFYDPWTILLTTSYTSSNFQQVQGKAVAYMCIYTYIYIYIYISQIVLLPFKYMAVAMSPFIFSYEHFIPLLVFCQINGNFLFCFENFVTTHMLMTLTPSNNKHIACTNTFWHA